jgi:hypothetical protein
MKLHKITLFLSAYILALGIFAWTGYYFYADYTMHSRLQNPTMSNHFQTDIAYVDLPRITLTLPASAMGEGNIRMDITLEVENKYAAQVEGFRPRIADKLIHYTRSLNYKDLARPNSTLWLKPDMLSIVNNVSDSVPIRNIIFRQFLVL